MTSACKEFGCSRLLKFLPQNISIRKSIMKKWVIILRKKKKVTCKWYINSLIFPDIICSVASMEVCVYHKCILYGKILKWNFWSFTFQNNNNSKTKKKQTNKRHLSQYLEQHNFTKLFYFIILHEKGISKKWCNNYVDRHFNKTAHINLKILL